MRTTRKAKPQKRPTKAKCAAKTATKIKAVIAGGEVVWAKAAAGEEDQGPSKFTGTAYGGGVLPRYTAEPPLEYDYVIDLKGMAVAKHPKVNLEHERTKRVGHIDNTAIDATLEVEGTLSAATSHRDEVVQSAKANYPWELSIEADLWQRKLLASGQTQIVNGQTVTGPKFIFSKSRFTDLAFVDRGADESNTVSVAAAAAGETEMNEFEKWLVESGFDPEAMSEKQMAKMKAMYDREKAAEGGGTATATRRTTISQIKEEERLEVERCDAIVRLTKDAIKEHRFNPKMMDAIAELGEQAQKDGTPVEKFELELYRNTRIQASHFKIVSRAEPDEKVLECALARAAGLPNLEKHYSEPVLEAVERTGLKNFSLQGLLIRAACARGYDASPGDRITQGNLRKILRYALPPEEDDVRFGRATQFSTINLPGIFGNVANKELLAGFTEEDGSWREIARIATATDFKTVTAYRLTDSLEYELLPKGGEIKHGKLGEESYTRTLKTYAKMLGLDRQDIINDDLSAFDDLRTRLGRGAARKFNNVFWAAFMNNASFFTTARGNFISGATTNLGTDGVGLGLGVTAFQKLLSSDGKRIGGAPRILLVPPELQYVADQLWTGGGADQQTVANTNVFKGKYRPVVVPWLSDAAFTGNSTTAWYLFRDNNILAPMVVSFLNGNQAPTVESTDADFNNLGILFRGFHDFSADQAEYLAGIKSKGAV